MRRIDFWIFQEYAPLIRGLPLYRIFFACGLLIFYLPESSEVAALPRSFFAPPPSVAWFFSGFPPRTFFWGVDYLLELGALCLLFGYRTRLSCLSMAALLVAGNSFRYATGKINHEILIVAVLLCLAWSDWGARYSSDERRLPARARVTPPAWPVCLLMLMIGLCMLSAALPKAKSGWLDPHTEACRGQLILNYVGAERPMPLADLMLSTTSPFYWKFLDYSTVLLEGAFVFAMFRLPAMRVVAASACIFHAFIYYSMDIFFYANLAAYACLVDFRIFLRSRFFRASLIRFHRLAERVTLLPLALVSAIFYGVFVGLGSPRWMGSAAFLDVAAFITLLAGVASILHLVLQARRHFLVRDK